jgi:hypothetical protein
VWCEEDISLKLKGALFRFYIDYRLATHTTPKVPQQRVYCETSSVGGWFLVPLPGTVRTRSTRYEEYVTHDFSIDTVSACNQSHWALVAFGAPRASLMASMCAENWLFLLPRKERALEHASISANVP